MTRRHRRAVVALALAPVLVLWACSTGPAQQRFACPRYSTFPECPAERECPRLPLGEGGCDDEPGLFGRPTLRANAGRVKGCALLMGDMQMCICQDLRTADGGLAPGWGCPL